MESHEEHGYFGSPKLIQDLLNDAQMSFKELLKNEESQYYRRNAVRSAFGCIEAICAVLSNEVWIKYRRGDVSLSERERKVIEGQEIELSQRIKKCFSAYAKLHKANFILNISSENHAHFKEAKNVRNNLVHPKRYKHILIEKNHVTHVLSAYIWLRDEFIRLMESVIESHLSGVSEQDRKAIERIISERDKKILQGVTA